MGCSARSRHGRPRLDHAVDPFAAGHRRPPRPPPRRPRRAPRRAPPRHARTANRHRPRRRRSLGRRPRRASTSSAGSPPPSSARAQRRTPGRRGRGTVQRLLEADEAHTKSELERRFLRFLRRHGLPRPDGLNVRVAGFRADCRLPRRAASSSSSTGARSTSAVAQMAADRLRDEQLPALGPPHPAPAVGRLPPRRAARDGRALGSDARRCAPECLTSGHLGSTPPQADATATGSGRARGSVRQTSVASVSAATAPAITAS